MKKYSILIIDADDDLDFYGSGYNELVECAFHTVDSDDLSVLLRKAIEELNENIANNFFYALVDNKEGIILNK